MASTRLSVRADGMIEFSRQTNFGDRTDVLRPDDILRVEAVEHGVEGKQSEGGVRVVLRRGRAAEVAACASLPAAQWAAAELRAALGVAEQRLEVAGGDL